jgi:hypothetical protein
MTAEQLVEFLEQHIHELPDLMGAGGVAGVPRRPAHQCAADAIPSSNILDRTEGVRKIWARKGCGNRTRTASQGGARFPCPCKIVPNHAAEAIFFEHSPERT